MTTLNATTIQVSIGREPGDVYRYIRDARNLPAWLTSFVRSVTPAGDGWTLETTAGNLSWRFVADNDFGVIDHHVGLPNGEDVFNPMRVVRNGSGSEVLFTLFQRPGMSDEEFKADRGMVENDLSSLKAVMES